jgi:hypothetical protein
LVAYCIVKKVTVDLVVSPDAKARDVADLMVAYVLLSTLML